MTQPNDPRVPYQQRLVRKDGCHIDVKVPSPATVRQYVEKYVSKGQGEGQTQRGEEGKREYADNGRNEGTPPSLLAPGDF